MQILGVRIDEITREMAQEKVRSWLGGAGQHKIFTPNPEMLVDAQKDVEFLKVLNKGALNICDGIGVQFVSRGRLKRIAGIDFMLDVCRIAEETGRSIYLLGSGDKKVIADAAAALQEKFPKLNIVGFHQGPHIPAQQFNNLTIEQFNNTVDHEVNESVIDDIILKAPDILFVGFGHGKQEKWIDRFLKDLPSVKIAMGVGGAFDMLGGKIKRAPKFMRAFWLEWLWRLILQPWRIGRIWKATVVFLWAYCFLSSRAERPRPSGE